MILMLDRTLIKGDNLKIAGDLELDSSDASGQTSSTATIEKGMKAKNLNCSINIKYQDEAYLSALIELAEATNNGKRKVYLITNRTARVMGIKQVKFNGKLSPREDDTLNMWVVTFNLIEHISNPERVEARQASSNTEQQQAPGVPIAEKEVTEQLTWIEQKFKSWDDWLGGNNKK